MYEDFVGFHEFPFSPSPDPRFPWLSETHQDGLAILYSGTTRRKGFTLRTGEVGAGKTAPPKTTLQKVDSPSLLFWGGADLAARHAGAEGRKGATGPVTDRRSRSASSSPAVMCPPCRPRGLVVIRPSESTPTTKLLEVAA